MTPKGHAADDASWWEIDVAGTPGFIRDADLGEPGAEPAKGKVQAGGPKTPTLAPPTSIRALNRAVLTARTQGVDRLKALERRRLRGPT